MTFEHIQRGFDLTDEDIALAVESRETTRALLDRLAVVSAPNGGCPKVLLIFAHLAHGEADWMDGDLRVELVAGGDLTVFEVMTDLGGGMRERLMHPVVMKVPIDEFRRSVERLPQLIEPLLAQKEPGGRLVLTTAAPDSRHHSATPAAVSIDEGSLCDLMQVEPEGPIEVHVLPDVFSERPALRGLEGVPALRGLEGVQFGGIDFAPEDLGHSEDVDTLHLATPSLSPSPHLEVGDSSVFGGTLAGFDPPYETRLELATTPPPPAAAAVLRSEELAREAPPVSPLKPVWIRRAKTNPESAPTPLNDVSLPLVNDVSLPLVNDVSLPLVNDVSLPLVNDVSLPLVNDVSLPLVNDVSLPLVNGPAGPRWGDELITRVAPDSALLLDEDDEPTKPVRVRWSTQSGGETLPVVDTVSWTDAIAPRAHAPAGEDLFPGPPLNLPVARGADDDPEIPGVVGRRSTPRLAASREVVHAPARPDVARPEVAPVRGPHDLFDDQEPELEVDWGPHGQPPPRQRG